MGWLELTTYAFGIVAIAFLVGSWWLAHFIAAGTATDAGEKLNWSWLRKWSFWASGLPLFLPPIGGALLWLLVQLFASLVEDGAELYSFVVAAYLNGLIWGFFLASLTRYLFAW